MKKQGSTDGSAEGRAVRSGDRANRLKSALKANLQKRKAQARARHGDATQDIAPDAPQKG